MVKAVAEGKAPLTMLMVDMKAANALAKALKSAFNVPGLRAVPKAGVRTKG